MKSYVNALLSLYDGLFRDLEYRWPEMAEDVQRDRIRFARMFQARGLQFVLIDLPAIGKHLDRCLDEGTYTKSGLPASKAAGGRFGEIPVFLRGLYLRVFDVCKTETSIVLSVKSGEKLDYDAICFLRQFLYAAKKAKVDCQPSKHRKAVEAFYECEAQLPVPDPWWDEELPYGSGEKVPMPETAFSRHPDFRGRADQLGLPLTILDLLDKVSSKVSEALGPFNPQQWKFKHGNGAKSNIKAGEDRYAFPTWSMMLDSVFPYADYAHHAWNAWADATWRVDDFIDPSIAEADYLKGYCTPSARLISVLKTYKGPRLIAPEPVENAWAQQCLKDFFYQRTSRSWLGTFVRFDDQTLSRELCVKASADSSGATIDLSEASDRVTTSVVGCTFKCMGNHEPLLYALRASRTRLLQTPQGMVKLRKFSTMGSACTFPVETLVFLTVALTGVCHSHGIRNPTVKQLLAFEGKISVFGDDIIVPAESYQVVCSLLECLHFKVNRDKSFSGPGGFREACGVDAFRGIEVTPAYWLCPVDDNPESVVSVVEQSNNFYKRFLVNASEAIREPVLRMRRRIPMVPYTSAILGFASFVVPLNTQKVRRNRDLQIKEFLAPVLSSRREVNRVPGDRNLHQYFTEQPEPTTSWTAGVSEQLSSQLRQRWIPIHDWTSAE